MGIAYCTIKYFFSDGHKQSTVAKFVVSAHLRAKTFNCKDAYARSVARICFCHGLSKMGVEARASLELDNVIGHSRTLSNISLTAFAFHTYSTNPKDLGRVKNAPDNEKVRFSVILNVRTHNSPMCSTFRSWCRRGGRFSRPTLLTSASSSSGPS